MPIQDNLLALPPQAIFGTNRIYTVEDNRLQANKITRVGDMRDNEGKAKVLVRSDQLQAGDLILATQLPNAITGLLVEVASNKPQAAATE